MTELDQSIIIVNQWPREILYKNADIAKRKQFAEEEEKRSEEILKKSKAIVDEWAEENLLLKRDLTFEEFIDILPDVRKLNTKQLILGSAANLLVFSLVNFVPIPLMILGESYFPYWLGALLSFLGAVGCFILLLYDLEFFLTLKSWRDYQKSDNIFDRLWIKYFRKPLHYFNFLRKKKIERAIHILIENKKIDKIFS